MNINYSFNIHVPEFINTVLKLSTGINSDNLSLNQPITLWIILSRLPTMTSNLLTSDKNFKYERIQLRSLFKNEL